MVDLAAPREGALLGKSELTPLEQGVRDGTRDAKRWFPRYMPWPPEGLTLEEAQDWIAGYNEGFWSE